MAASSFAATGAERQYGNNVGACRHAVAFRVSVCSVSSGLPGGNFIPTLVTGGLLGQLVGLVAVKHLHYRTPNITYVMLISMSAFLVAIERTPLTAIVLITEITGHFRSLYPSVVVGGFDVLFYGAAPDEVFQRNLIRGYD